MATGRRAFQKKTAVDTLGAILNDEPEALEVAASQVPAPLRWVIARCLGKEPRQRYAATEDLARELATVRDHLSEASISAPGSLVAGALSARHSVYLRAALLAAGVALGLTFFILGRQTAKAPPLPSFHRLTFRRGSHGNARFTPDGQTIIFNGWYGTDDSAPQLFSTRPESPESTALSLPSADLASISTLGELAIVLPNATLARSSMGGGAPRELLENVQLADWTPDGKSLAVSRSMTGKTRVEFPIGKAIFETPGWISFLRVSKKGDRVAFFDHPTAGDDRCSVVILDHAGKKKILSEGWVQSGGLFWSLDDREVWFSAGRVGTGDTEIRAVTMSGEERLIYRAPLMLVLLDVSQKGRVLLSRGTVAFVIRGLAPGETAERDLSWLDNSYVVDFSPDGKFVLIGDQGMSSGPNYSVGLRKTDGSPAVRLGEGGAQALSPDGKWALAYLPHPEPAQLILLPTGPGEPKPLTHDSINHMAFARWLPNGHGIVFLGSEPGHGARLYVQDLAGGAARAISPEGFSDAGPISPDSKLVTTADPGGRLVFLPVEGGEPRPIPGLAEGEGPIQWTADGTSLFVGRVSSTAKIYRLELSNQKRELWKELASPEHTIDNLHLTPDGKSYAYNYSSGSNDLYIVDGLK